MSARAMATLTRLSIRDFRNIARAELSLPSHGIAVVGENGHGKTNLLEAVYYFHLLRSARGARDQDLIRFDAPAFHLGAQVRTARAHEISAAFERAGKRKKIVIDGADVSRVSDALGVLPSVMVSPRDVELVIGAPTERRRFLDVMLALTSPRYLVALQRYRAALVRRNALLRQGVLRPNTPDLAEQAIVWETPLAQHGAVLVAERAVWVRQNADAFSSLCTSIGERAHVSMRYLSDVAHGIAHGVAHSIDSEVTDFEPMRDAARHALTAALERKRPIDLKRGATHVGPHRDDLVMQLDGREMRIFGSAGQQRTVSIALRILEADALRTRTGETPLLLLDDPFAELDPRRAAHILALLQGESVGQTILVVPNAADIPRELTTLARWTVRQGELRPEHDLVESDPAERAPAETDA